MGDLISNDAMTQCLENYIPNCLELNIISAFVTKPAITWLNNLIANRSIKVSLVGRFAPQDFLSGASDLNTIKQCILNGFEVKALSNLHAKIYQVDRDFIFTGSANLTGKGLALVEEGNLESCTKVCSSEESIEFIENIIDASSTLNLDIVEKMEAFIEDFPASKEAYISKWWPKGMISDCKVLFVSDFPLSKPGVAALPYVKNPSLEFAIIEANQKNYPIAKRHFKRSKVYKWLKLIVLKNEGGRDLSFGAISQEIHNTLSDDPTPYRREIKDLLANLYLYIKLYGEDEMEIFIPGRRSEIIRMK